MLQTSSHTHTHTHITHTHTHTRTHTHTHVEQRLKQATLVSKETANMVDRDSSTARWVDRKSVSWLCIICACKAEKYCCVCMCVCMCACVRVCVCACSHNRPMLVDRKSVSWLCIICACKAEKYCCVCVCARAVITCPWLWTASLRADCASSARVKQKNIGVCVCVQS